MLRGGIRIWDVNKRSQYAKLPEYQAAPGPRGLAFSRDSHTLAYNENDFGAIQLWDIASREVIGQLAGHQNEVPALAFSPKDDQTLASGSRDRTAKLWNVAERRRKESEFTIPGGGFTCLAFSSDDGTLAMGGEGGAGRVIRLVDLETGNKKAELRGHLGDISGLAFTPDGKTLLSASGDGTIRVWDPVPVAKEELVHSFDRNSISLDWLGYGPALCLSPDGRHLLTVYTDHFSLWDTLHLTEGERHLLPFKNTRAAFMSTRAAAESQLPAGLFAGWQLSRRRLRCAVPFADVRP
jgi:WD40 repeat protein